MNKLMPIGLIAVLSSAGTVAMAQAPASPSQPTQQTTPRADPSTQPGAGTQRQGDSSTQRQGESATQRQGGSANQSAAATAASKDDMSRQHTALQAMDTNRDGLVSRSEYMAHYEGEFGKMKKDSAGHINIEDLAASARPIASTR